MLGSAIITLVSDRLLSREVGGIGKRLKSLLANPVLTIRTLTQMKVRVAYTLYGHSGKSQNSLNFSDSEKIKV